jgi:hypothetical protein
MFNVSKIQTEFKGLVALRQPLDTAVDRFLSTQYLASSNLFLDDVEYFRPEYWIDSQSFATATDSDIQNKWDELEKSVIANVMAKIFNKPSYIDRNLIYSTTFDRNELFTIHWDFSSGTEVPYTHGKLLGDNFTTHCLDFFNMDQEVEDVVVLRSDGKKISRKNIQKHSVKEIRKSHNIHKMLVAGYFNWL